MNLAMNVTFVGLTVVFLSLILLTFILRLFSKGLNSFNKSSANDSVNSESEAAVLEIEEEEHVIAGSNPDDQELIAVLTAAISAALGNKPGSSIRVKSFKRITQATPVWNATGRVEQIASKL